MSASPSPAIPFSVALLGIALFAVMDALMKGLVLEMGTYNTMFWRGCVSMVLAAVLYAWRRPAWPKREVLHLHLQRGVLIAVMAFLFFWGLAYVPIAEAIALSFIAPLIALYLAALLLGERVGSKAVVASVVGFAGALVVMLGKLSGDYDDNVFRGMAAILLSALLYAYNLILQRRQALVSQPVEIVFFQTLALFVLYLTAAPVLAVPPGMDALPGLLITAVLSMGSLMLLSWAYARAEARVLIPVEYTAFIWAALFGWLLYDEQLTITTVAGTSLIVAGCLLAASQRDEVVEHVETTSL